MKVTIGLCSVSYWEQRELGRMAKMVTEDRKETFQYSESVTQEAAGTEEAWKCKDRTQSESE